MSRSGLSPIISYVVAIGIVISATVFVVSAGFPILEDMKDNSAIQTAIKDFNALDSIIRNIAQGGENAQTIYRVRSRQGQVTFDNETDSIIYEIESRSSIISPGTLIEQGNVLLSADANAEIDRITHESTDCYRIRNEYIEACIRKYGSSSSFAQANVSDTLLYVKNRNSNRTIEPRLNVSINGNDAYGNGRLKTVATTGKRLGEASVDVLVKPTSLPGYTLHVQLDSVTDVLQLEIE